MTNFVSGPMFHPAKSQFWESIFDKNGMHYNIFAGSQEGMNLAALKELFPEGKCNELNLCLFGTSGIHGMYGSLEALRASFETYGVLGDAIEELPEDYEGDCITFLVIHPRTVTLRYGNAVVTSIEDIEFLEKLRDSTKQSFLEFCK